MTIRELIERLEGLENQDREIRWVWEQYNPSSDMWDMTYADFTGEEWDLERDITILLSPRTED